MTKQLDQSNYNIINCRVLKKTTHRFRYDDLFHIQPYTTITTFGRLYTLTEHSPSSATRKLPLRDGRFFLLVVEENADAMNQ